MDKECRVLNNQTDESLKIHDSYSTFKFWNSHDRVCIVLSFPTLILVIKGSPTINQYHTIHMKKGWFEIFLRN